MSNNGDSKTVLSVNRDVNGNYEIKLSSESMTELYTALGLARLQVDNLVVAKNMKHPKKFDIVTPATDGLRNFLNKRRNI